MVSLDGLDQQAALVPAGAFMGVQSLGASGKRHKVPPLPLPLPLPLPELDCLSLG